MLVREYRPTDFDTVKKIHEKYYAREFSLPDFLHDYLLSVTIEDDDGVVTIGGVRNIAEVVAVTDRDHSVRARREALINLLQAMSFAAGTYNYTQIHAFVQDKDWLNHLVNYGFHPTKGNALVMEI